jgi:hypothetical protein
MAAATGTRTLRPRLTSTAGTSTAGTSTFWTDTIGASAVAAILDGDPVSLPGTPWSVRPAAGLAGRPAVEICAAGSLVDVMVAPALPCSTAAAGTTAGWARCACADCCAPPAGGVSRACRRRQLRDARRLAQISARSAQRSWSRHCPSTIR